jgi:hypothetical protein
LSGVGRSACRWSLWAFAAGTHRAYLLGQITIVKGQPTATFVWRLVLHEQDIRPVEVTVHYASGTRVGRVVAHLCGPCRTGARGRVTGTTGRPWFGAGRSTGSIPDLIGLLRTRAGRELRGGVVTSGFRAYVT